jgi:Fe-S-cluster containining protein
MKSIDPDELDRLPGIPLNATTTFNFRCHRDLACFNRCCQNLNLFLYPYDVLRLKKGLEMNSDRFLESHVDVVLREGNSFPDVLLKMADTPSRSCPFLSQAGCRVYRDRPDTCRAFPVEHGMWLDTPSGKPEMVAFFRPPEFCLGPHETHTWTLSTWADDQQAAVYHQMTAQWAAVKALFQKDPWGAEGVNGPRGKMAFMAAYNIDRFREFVFQSSFLKRYRVKKALIRKLRISDRELLQFGFEWIRFFTWNIPSRHIRS